MRIRDCATKSSSNARRSPEAMRTSSSPLGSDAVVVPPAGDWRSSPGGPWLGAEESSELMYQSCHSLSRESFAVQVLREKIVAKARSEISKSVLGHIPVKLECHFEGIITASTMYTVALEVWTPPQTSPASSNFMSSPSPEIFTFEPSTVSCSPAISSGESCPGMT